MPHKEKLEELKRRREEAQAMGGARKLEARRNAGVLNARERLHHLLDDDSFLEAGLHAYSIREQTRNKSPADGKIAGMTNEDISRLMLDAGIIRNRLKIEATISNAQAWLKIMESGNDGFANFIWATVDGITKINQPQTKTDVPSKTKEAEILSKRLKKAGFRFVGPTICYAFMQSMGLVNDHIKGCWKAP